MSALIRALRSTAPLLLLGLTRLFLVKSTDYQEHVSEYGVHWNFFFTLAFLPPLVTVMRAVTRDRVDHALVGIGVAACYQLALTAGGVEAWIMSSAPRVGLLAANKEGMSSLFGRMDERAAWESV